MEKAKAISIQRSTVPSALLVLLLFNSISGDKAQRKESSQEETAGERLEVIERDSRAGETKRVS